MDKLKIVKGFRAYKIDRYGNIYSTLSKKYLKPRKTTGGYLVISLNSDCGNRKSVMVHRLVATAFVEKGDIAYNVVNHLDGDRSNCSADNLEWCNTSQNIKHSYREGSSRNSHALEGYCSNTPVHELERWVPVLGYIGIYEVSSYGRIRSISRAYVDSRGHQRYHMGKIKTPTLRGSYYIVSLTDLNGKEKKHSIHRLVMQSFTKKLGDGKVVNHIDGNTRNNQYSNLEWTTYSKNTQHYFDNK